jgi:hypothetical protein
MKCNKVSWIVSNHLVKMEDTLEINPLYNVVSFFNTKNLLLMERRQTNWGHISFVNSYLLYIQDLFVTK